MLQRFITGAVATALLVPILIFSDTVVFPITVALCSILAIFEMMRCIGMKKSLIFAIPLMLLAAGTPFFIRYIGDLEIIRTAGWTAVLVALLYFFAVMTLSHGKYPPSAVGLLFTMIFYIILAFNCILILRDYTPNGNLTFLAVFICSWVTDVFAYLCGKFFGRGGKHKLLPDVSPKKTVEGSIGGTVFCVLSMILFGFIVSKTNDLSVNYLHLALAGLVASLISQLGDLLMSVIKRAYGIKDYGKLFPGHGGMLDRFDSILAVAVALLGYCTYFNFFA